MQNGRASIDARAGMLRCCGRSSLPQQMREEAPPPGDGRCEMGVARCHAALALIRRVLGLIREALRARVEADREALSLIREALRVEAGRFRSG